MSYRYGGWGYRQPTVAELKADAAREIARAASRGEHWEPVAAASGRGPLASSWWGRAWCDNLERYADFANRIDRGRRYVRAGAVLDLHIEKGVVTAKVMGSRGVPYEVEVKIEPLPERRATELMDRCGQKVKDLDTLVRGEFPEELKGVFFEKNGLFPSPSEIDFGCSCPDWAYMCKHVASVLYGIGVRFDQDPLLFFQLRGIDPNMLIDAAVQNRLESMLENADRPSRRIMDDSSWHDLFGLQVVRTHGSPGQKST